MVEVKGCTDGSTGITLTCNEMLHALNKAEDWWLALVHVPKDGSISGKALEQMLSEDTIHQSTVTACEIRYVPRWFVHEPNFGSTGENFNITRLWDRGMAVH